MTRPPIPPGEILGDELREIGISANQLARQLKVPQNRISQIIAGKRAITGDTALRLGRKAQLVGRLQIEPKLGAVAGTNGRSREVPRRRRQGPQLGEGPPI